MSPNLLLHPAWLYKFDPLGRLIFRSIAATGSGSHRPFVTLSAGYPYNVAKYGKVEGLILYGYLSRRIINHLFSLPNVVGLGYGFKETTGKLTGQKGIVVLVNTKVPESQLARQHVVPRSIGGIVSDVIESGHIFAWGYHPNTDYLYSNTVQTDNPRKARWRPAPGGVSIGHYQITAGTLGAVVYDKYSGERLILSNNHVLANTTNGEDLRAKIGDPILQPGAKEGGTVGKDTIAKLYRFVPIKYDGINIVDAAAAKPIEQSLIVPDILDVGTVTGTTLPKLGMEVKKSGLSSGLTHGIIRVVNMIAMVNYGGQILRFKDQILVGPLSKPGDSGSLVLNNKNQAVGLLFGGSKLFTIINPIIPVLDMLDIRFTEPVSRKRSV